MLHKTCILCIRGGPGKSTISTQLTKSLNDLHYKSLFVDADPQHSGTKRMGIYPEDVKFTLNDVFEWSIGLDGEGCMVDAITASSWKGIDLIASEAALANREEYNGELGDYRLKKAFSNIKTNYKYMIVDTGPGRGKLIRNVLYAVDSAIVIVEPDPDSIIGANEAILAVKSAKQFGNPNLKLLGVWVNKYLKNNLEDPALVNEIETTFNGLVWKPYLPSRIAVKKARSRQIPIELIPDEGAQEYVQAMKELSIQYIKKVNNNE